MYEPAEHPAFADAVRTEEKVYQTFHFLDEDGDRVPMWRETPSQSEGSPTWRGYVVTWSPAWFKSEKNLSMNEAGEKIRSRVRAVNYRRYRKHVERVELQGEVYAPDEVEWLSY